jgi:7,8-dihydro-6-hydroxymethylpterin-pyrophosphokinase
MNTFQILLASNSDAAVHLALAMVRLKSAFPRNILFSEVLESHAVNKAGEICLDGGVYLNALCLAQTEDTMDSVQAFIKVMEAAMGRKRGFEAKGLVAIDLDLIVWNGVILRHWEVEQRFYQDCLKSLRLV